MSSIIKRIIPDSSSLILLHKCGIIRSLFLYCNIVIPERVYAEITVPGHEGAGLFSGLRTAGSIEVCIPVERDTGIFSSGLHPGEMDVISLYLERKGEYIIIDDGKGAAFCRDNRIPYINALLAVKILFMKRLITEHEYSAAWKWLVKNGRYSGKIISWAENAGVEVLEEFL